MNLFIQRSRLIGVFAIIAIIASQTFAGPLETKKPADKEYDGQVRPILEPLTEMTAEDKYKGEDGGPQERFSGACPEAEG